MGMPEGKAIADLKELGAKLASVTGNKSPQPPKRT